jgi:hypothetical protein
LPKKKKKKKKKLLHTVADLSGLMISLSGSARWIRTLDWPCFTYCESLINIINKLNPKKEKKKKKKKRNSSFALSTNIIQEVDISLSKKTLIEDVINI